jgi:tetratricopeptide (TPR) repeat protein
MRDELLRAEFGGDVSEPLAKWLRDTAGGNPLFLSELVKLLKQNAAVAEEHGEWHLTASVADLPVPRSAEAVIESRVEALDAEEIKLLQYASVQGTEFDSIVLAGMLEEDELDLLERLERLDRNFQMVSTVGELDLPDGEIATILVFRHTLMQTVLYRQVVGKRRVLLHRKAGELLERVFADRVDDVSSKLAHHYDQGRVAEKAHRYASIAADGARRVYAHWEAERLYRIALAHSPGSEATLAVQERLGDVYATVGYLDQSTAAFRAALEADATPDVSLRLQRKLATVDRRAGRVPAPELLQRLRSLVAAAEGNDEERSFLLLEVCFLPNAVDVVETAGEVVAIAERLGDPSLMAKALEQLAVALIFGGRPREALPHLDRAFAVGGGASDPVRAARYHNIRGIANTKVGEYREALGDFEQMLVMSEKLSDSNFIGVACSNIGAELLILGEYDRAEEVLQRACTIHRRRDRANMVQSLFNLAKRAHWSGDLELGLERYTEVLEVARELDYWTSEAAAGAGRGLCLLEMGRLDEARRSADAVAAVVADRDQWFDDRDFLEILLAHLEAIDGSHDAAVERLRRAIDTLADADLFVCTQVRLELVHILMDVDRDAARTELEVLDADTGATDFSLRGEIESMKMRLMMGESAGVGLP